MLCLQQVLRSWGAYSLEVQKELFDTALLATGEDDWQQLEEGLSLALDLA